MAKRVERIDDARRIPEYVARAFATAMNGRPGPVVLVLPEDMLVQQVVQPLPRIEPVQAWSDPGALRALREMLLKAQRPLVIAGGGGWTPQAAQALQRFAEAWRLPVSNAFRFQDCFDNDHPLYAGDIGLGINPALAARVRTSDLLLVIGARLGESTTAGYTLIEAPRPVQKLVHIHASAEELNRVYQADLAICATERRRPQPGGARAAAAAALGGLDPGRSATTARTSIRATAACFPGGIDMPALIDTLYKHLPEDAVLTNGAGNFASWLHRFYRYRGMARGHKTQLAPTVGAMGYGVPAVGAAIVAPGRTVFTIAGDGDFMMNGC